MPKLTGKNFIYIASLPDIAGYGLTVAANSEKEAMAALRQAYNDLHASTRAAGIKWGPDVATFSRALDYFGGGCQAVILGKVYNDGFKE